MMDLGEFGLAREGDREQEHDGPDAAHVRRSPAADLHADAPRFLPAFRQLGLLQETVSAQQQQPEGEFGLRRPN